MKKIITVLMALVLMSSFAFGAYAAPSDFVPSAEIKPGPDIVVDPDEDGVPAYGEIIMPDGTVIVVPEGVIIITPVKDKDDVDVPSIGEDLNSSLEDVKNADTLEDLIDNLQDILDQIANGTDVDDLIITDMFHIYIPEEYEKYLEEGGKLKITLKLPEDTLLGFADINDVWSVLFGDSFIDNGDGTVTLYITGSGTYSFVKDSGKVDVDPDSPGVSSPTTGDRTVQFVAFGVFFAVAGAALLIVAKKQKA